MLLVIAAFPTVLLLPWLYAVWVTPPDLFTWLTLVGTGIFGGLGHFLLILAHRHVPASVLAPFSYTQIIGMVTLGYLVFGHVPRPGPSRERPSSSRRGFTCWRRRGAGKRPRGRRETGTGSGGGKIALRQ